MIGGPERVVSSEEVQAVERGSGGSVLGHRQVGYGRGARED